MSRRRQNVLLIALLAGAALWLLSEAPTSQVDGDESSIGTTPSVSQIVTPDNRLAVAERLSDWRVLYDTTGPLSAVERKALLARRAAEAEATAAALGALGAGGVGEVLSAYADAEKSKEKLLLIDSLGRNNSEEAVNALASLFEEEDMFRLREEALRALGRSGADGTADPLIAAMVSGDDERLQQIAAMSLYGDAAALAALTQVVHQSSAPMNARLEAIHSIGGIGSESAMDALTAIAVDEAIEVRVQLYAEKERVRSAG